MNAEHIFFEVLGCLGVKIRTTRQHWLFIIRRKHPEVKGLEREVQLALLNPDCIRVSREDKDVFLCYAKLRNYFLCVVCKHLNGEGFLITSYITSK